MIGSGVTAAVYAARDPEGQRAAVKVLFDHMAADDEVRRRFGQEARVVGSIDHPGVVKILDHDTTSDRDAYIALEYLEGETLAARAKARPLDVDEVVEYSTLVLDALAAAHDAGVVHRDLKPGNIFLLSGGGIKILDFGVARVTAPDATSIGTQVGMAIGTVAYMAPEQALGKHDRIDGRTDVFSMGAIMFRLLAKRPVHQAETMPLMLQKMAVEPAPGLAEVAPNLPPDLVSIVDMSLAFDRKVRYESARAMHDDLVAFAASEPPPVASSTRHEQPTVAPPSDAEGGKVAVAATVLATEVESGPVSDAAADEARALLGKVVGQRYRIDDLLGSGGMGAVYRAHHLKLQKDIALKVLHREMTYKPEVVARFEREAVALGRIDHPNVAAATDFGKLDEGHFYLALEYVDGTSLRDVLKRQGALPERRARAIALQISMALESAHALGIVHRDLKPENIMLLEKDGVSDFVKVLDFGIAKLGEGDTPGQKKLTRMGAVFGTPEYMSPEQAMGASVDARSDIYSLGVLLFEMLSGKTPFEGTEMMTLLTRIMTEPAPDLPSSVNRRLAAVVSHLLDKKAEARPTLQELNQELLAPISSAQRPQLPTKDQVLHRFDHLLQALKRPVRLGRFEVAVWTVALVALGGLGAGIVLVLTVNAVTANETPQTEPGKRAAFAARKVERPKPVGSSELAPAELEELTRIEELPVYKRRRDDWLALARTTAKLGRYKESTLAYQSVLALKASMRDDETLLKDLRRAGSDPESFKLVVNLCANKLGTAGLDILWDLWLELRTLPNREKDSDFLKKRLRVLSRRASPELRTAIELSTTENCEKLEKSLERATQYSDERALPRLKELVVASSCPSADGTECFRCLEGHPDLERALKHAQDHPAPKPY